METTIVTTYDDFVEHALDQEDDWDFDRRDLEELWDLWSERRDNGAEDYLLTVPEWFSQSEFGARRPFAFVEIEYDNDSKGAVLFDNILLVDVSIIENHVIDQVSTSQVLDMLDISDDNDYIDDPGMDWIPRKLMTVYQRND